MKKCIGGVLIWVFLLCLCVCSYSSITNYKCVFLLHSYRKLISNMCEGGLNKEESGKQHACPLMPPSGLQLGIKGQMLTVVPGDDITFMVHQEQVWCDFCSSFILTGLMMEYVCDGSRRPNSRPCPIRVWCWCKVTSYLTHTHTHLTW